MFSLLQVNDSGFAAYYDACQVDPSLSWKVWFAMCFVKEFDRTVVHSMNFSLSIKVLMILTAWCNTGYQVAADNYIAANHNERNPNSRRQWVLAFSGFCISIHLIWAALSRNICKTAARLAIESGVAGILVSNHGGRQLDHDPATISCLEEVCCANCPHGHFFSLSFYFLYV